jgi:hypothetical protein
MPAIRFARSSANLVTRTRRFSKSLCLLTLLASIPALSQSQPELTSHRDINQTTLPTGPYGIISTIAGTGYYGYSGIGGPALQTDLANPASIAVDSAGNLYIADPGSAVILKVAATTGDTSVYVGNQQSGYSGDGALATNAQINSPESLKVDAQGNLYFVDLANNVIRKVTAKTGIISTVVGNQAFAPGYSGDGV